MKNNFNFSFIGFLSNTFAKRLFVFAAIASVFVVSCKKDISNAPTRTQSPTEQAYPGSSPKEQAESLGLTAYQHLKFYMTQKKAEDYIHPLIRKEVMESVESKRAEFKNLTAEQVLQKVEAENRISKSSVRAFRDLLVLVNSASDVQTVEELETRFKAFEAKTYVSKELTNDEKIIIAGTSAVFRGTMRFQAEMVKAEILPDLSRNNSTIQPRVTCLFGRNADCFGQVFVKAGIAGVTAAVKVAVAGSVTGGTAVASAFVVAFIAGTIGGILDVYNNDACKCGETPNTCFQVQIINPILDSNSPCSPYIGFVVSGLGTVPATFTCYTLSIGGYSVNPCSGLQSPWGAAQVGITP